MKIYFDNASSTPMDPEVFEAMKPWLFEHFGNPSSTHHHGRMLKAQIEKARKTIAQYLGAAPAEIFFNSGGTEGDNHAIIGAVSGLGLQQIVSTRIEHHAVTHTIEQLEKQGTKVVWLPVDPLGRIHLNDLREALHAVPKSLVSIMHANNELGTINPIHEIGAICREMGAVFHSDTVQSMANVAYNLKDQPIDMITASAHKFYGPKGVGFIYIRSGLGLAPLISGGAQERNVRAGTENVAGIVGLAFSLEKCYLSLERKNAHLLKLKTHLKEALIDSIPGVLFNGDTTPEGSIPTVLNVAFPGNGNEDGMLLFNFDILGISVSGGSACTSGSVKGSHVLAGIGCDTNRAGNSIRFSFGVQNTMEELVFLIEKIKELFPVKVG